MTLSSISQTKPDVFVTSKLSDLTLIIQSNERGKAAQRLVPVLESKVAAQDSLISLCNARVSNLFTIVNTRDVQVKSLYQIVANDSTVKANDDAIKVYQTEQIKSLNKSLKWQKVKTFFVGGTGLMIIGTLCYLFISK